VVLNVSSPSLASRAEPAKSSADTTPELAEQLVDTVAAIHRGIRRQGNRPPVFAALTSSQLELVRLVRRTPGASVADVAEILRLAPNTVSTLVTELTSRGILVRLSDPGDRRVARLELTQATRETAEAWRDQRLGTVATALARMSKADRAALVRSLPLLQRFAVTVDALRRR
jgi:DNA-binding MarR family transcriptional regulator